MQTFGQQSFLVIFDFDHTLVDCNSDVTVPKYLGRSSLQRELMKNDLQWTNLMSALLAPFTEAEIASAARESVVVDRGVVELMRFLAEVQDAAGQNSSLSAPVVEVCIASDANTLFIREVFEEHFPFVTVSQIHTNRYQSVEPELGHNEVCDETGEVRRSKLCWYEPEPGHNCALCLHRRCPHMCKSRIVHRCLQATRLMDPTVVFVGDGSNDYCPVVNVLRPRDFVFARSAYPLAKDLSTNRGGCSHVRLWQGGVELHALFREVLLERKHRLPTLARFADCDRAHFRHLTLIQRIPPIVHNILELNRGKLTDEAVDALTALQASLLSPLALVIPLPGHPALSQWLLNCANATLHTSVTRHQTTPRVAGGLPNWGQLPWLHGEIYLQNLMVHLAALPGTLPSPGATSTCKGASCRVLSTPYAWAFPLSPSDDSLPPSSREGAAAPSAGSDSVESPNSHRLRWTAADYSFLAPAISTLRTTMLDVYHAEKHRALMTLLHAKVVPLVATDLHWRKPDALETAADQRESLLRTLKNMLWGNCVDLCFTSAAAVSSSTTALSDSDDDRILGNQLPELASYIVDHLLTRCTSSHIDIVLDNAGVELAADLVFVAWLLVRTEFVAITLHGKHNPFYVSDTNEHDLHDLLNALASLDDSANCADFVSLLRYHLTVTKRLRYATDPCWTAPVEYRELPPHVVNTYFYEQTIVVPLVDPDAVETPSMRAPRMVYTPKSHLVVFKGDLNFRRLVGDRFWDHRSFYAGVDFETIWHEDDLYMRGAMQWSPHSRAVPTLREAISDYWPVDAVPVAALRTHKSEVTCGVPLEMLDAMEQRGIRNWRVSGEYAVALFSGACDSLAR